MFCHLSQIQPCLPRARWRRTVLPRLSPPREVPSSWPQRVNRHLTSSQLMEKTWVDIIVLITIQWTLSQIWMLWWIMLVAISSHLSANEHFLEQIMADKATEETWIVHRPSLTQVSAESWQADPEAMPEVSDAVRTRVASRMRIWSFLVRSLKGRKMPSPSTGREAWSLASLEQLTHLSFAR